MENLTTEKIIEIREALIGEYIGDWNKPQSYYEKLAELDNELARRRE